VRCRAARRSGIEASGSHEQTSVPTEEQVRRFFEGDGSFSPSARTRGGWSKPHRPPVRSVSHDTRTLSCVIFGTQGRGRVLRTSTPRRKFRLASAGQKWGCSLPYRTAHRVRTSGGVY
jgi:hypothetical protein